MQRLRFRAVDYNAGVRQLATATCPKLGMAAFGPSRALLGLAPATAAFAFALEQGIGLPSANLAALRNQAARIAPPMHEMLDEHDQDMLHAEDVVRQGLVDEHFPVNSALRDVVLAAAEAGIPRNLLPYILLGGNLRFANGAGLEHIWNQGLQLASYANPFEFKMMGSLLPVSWPDGLGYLQRLMGYLDRSQQVLYLENSEAAQRAELAFSMGPDPSSRILSYQLLFPTLLQGLQTFDGSLRLNVELGTMNVARVQQPGQVTLLRTRVSDKGWLSNAGSMELNPEVPQYLYLPGMVVKVEGLGLPLSEFPMTEVLKIAADIVRHKEGKKSYYAFNLTGSIKFQNGISPANNLALVVYHRADMLETGPYESDELNPDWMLVLKNDKGQMLKLTGIPVGPNNLEAMDQEIDSHRATSVAPFLPGSWGKI
jgi:hypothetical protein